MVRLLVLLGLLAAAVVGWRLANGPVVAEIRFCDVGQGDAAVISSGSYQIVIDGGPDASVLSCLGKAMPLGDRRVEAVIATHPGADHYRGLQSVIERHDIGSFLSPGQTKGSAEYDRLLAAVKAKGVPERVVRASDRLAFPGGKITVLSPGSLPLRVAGGSSQTENNNSLVFHARLGGVTALFTADAEREAERALLDAPDRLRADILKVGHHGSRNSSTPDFITAVRPKVSVISVGARNRYGHPTAQTLATLRDQASRIYRTDQNGTVKVVIRRDGYRVLTER